MTKLHLNAKDHGAISTGKALQNRGVTFLTLYSFVGKMDIEEFIITTFDSAFDVQVGAEVFSATLASSGANRAFPIKIGKHNGELIVQIGIDVLAFNHSLTDELLSNGLFILY